MYYEKKLINGKWYYKVCSKCVWILMNHNDLTKKVTDLTNQLKELNKSFELENDQC